MSSLSPQPLFDASGQQSPEFVGVTVKGGMSQCFVVVAEVLAHVIFDGVLEPLCDSFEVGCFAYGVAV